MNEMQARCLPAITKLLESGARLDKNDAAELVHCHPKTAQRILAHLWLEGYIHIASWRREHGSPIPAYLWGAGKDKAKPKAYSTTERAARRRSDPKVREKEAFDKRAARSVGRKVTLGVWGL